MIKLIIFDLDGTLINSVYDLADAVNSSLSEMEYPTHDTDKYYHFVGNGTVKLCERALPEKYRTEATITELHSLFAQKYEKCCLNKTIPYNGITETIRRLKRECAVKCAVASNKTDHFVNHIVETLFDKGTFDAIAGKRENVPTKPDPQIIYNIISQFNIDKSEVIIAGDSDVDVITAHNGGVPCIGCEWGFRGKEELVNAGADYLAHKPEDIFEIISRINNATAT